MADTRLRGPDLAILLGPDHVRILGGLDQIERECPCERIEPIDGTEVVLLELVEKIVTNEELERKALELGDYLNPLLDW